MHHRRLARPGRAHHRRGPPDRECDGHVVERYDGRLPSAVTPNGADVHSSGVIGRRQRGNAADVDAELSAIAPVLPVQPDGSWRDDLRFVADALQIGVRADALIAEHQDRQASVAELHGEALSRKLAVVQYETGGLLFWSAPDGFFLKPMC